jgi:cysteinyl-tRNA synthetase
MDDDFNMPKGLAVLFDLVNYSNKLFEDQEANKEDLSFAKKLIEEIADIFCLEFRKTHSGVLIKEAKQIKEKIELRLKYKKEKNYAAADKIRKELEAQGIILEDTKEGTEWRKKL